MAAPFRQTFRTFYKSFSHTDTSLKCCFLQGTLKSSLIKNERHFSFKNGLKFSSFRQTGLKSKISLILGGSAALLYISSGKLKSHLQQPVIAASSTRPEPRISREVRTDTDHSKLKLTLYQYQTCPFCCKVRAWLDYYGFNYDVVEVNSITKKQTKWSDYKKVPLLVAQMPGSDEVIIRDSTVIISTLESYLHDRSTSLSKLESYYPCLEEKIAGKIKYEFPNKYFIMFQDKADLGTTAKQREEERKWRKWADDHLVHMLSPNAYRTTSEALQAFHYFSDVGDWEHNFSTLERYVVIYAGAAVMYVMGKILKNKYKLKDDVRQSLYDSCNEWVKAVGKGRRFMGGDEPNLADLAVYGVLNSIEGCIAFQEALEHSKIGPWYNSTKQAIRNHQGSHPLNSKLTPSNSPPSAKK